MIDTKRHFSWFLLNMRNFCVSFFYKTELEWLLKETCWKVSTLTYGRQGHIFPSSVPGTARKYPHSIQTPGNQQTLPPGSVKQSSELFVTFWLPYFHSERHLPYTNLLQVTQFWESKMEFESIQLLFFCKIGFKKSGNFQNVLKFLT